MGRADQTTKVRGMFVHPAQVAEVVKRFPAALKARLVVQGEMANDSMALHVETQAAGNGEAELKAQIVRKPFATSPSCAVTCSWWRLAPWPMTAKSLRTHAVISKR
jgi:phenylacetate-coenzyme A ligase PaaK-like adenylate-forming protein